LYIAGLEYEIQKIIEGNYDNIIDEMVKNADIKIEYNIYNCLTENDIFVG
jgi:hypothetical protein